MSKTDDKTIAEKLKDLDELVAWFDNENLAIEDAIAKFAEAEKLADKIRTQLDQVENNIEQIKQKFN